MTPEQLAGAARSLREAAEPHTYIEPLRELHPQMDARDAYAIQRINTDYRLQQGRRLVGCKIGLTARAVQAQLGVDQPDFGVLFDDMGYGDGEPVPWRALQQPRIEAEIAFVLGRDLAMERPAQTDVVRAIDHALPTRPGPLWKSSPAASRAGTSALSTPWRTTPRPAPLSLAARHACCRGWICGFAAWS